jgi:hypothetical protein
MLGPIVGSIAAPAGTKWIRRRMLEDRLNDPRHLVLAAGPCWRTAARSLTNRYSQTARPFKRQLPPQACSVGTGVSFCLRKRLLAF